MIFKSLLMISLLILVSFDMKMILFEKLLMSYIENLEKDIEYEKMLFKQMLLHTLQSKSIGGECAINLSCYFKHDYLNVIKRRNHQEILELIPVNEILDAIKNGLKEKQDLFRKTKNKRKNKVNFLAVKCFHILFTNQPHNLVSANESNEINENINHTEYATYKTFGNVKKFKLTGKFYWNSSPLVMIVTTVTNIGKSLKNNSEMEAKKSMPSTNLNKELIEIKSQDQDRVYFPRYNFMQLRSIIPHRKSQDQAHGDKLRHRYGRPGELIKMKSQNQDFENMSRSSYMPLRSIIHYRKRQDQAHGHKQRHRYSRLRAIISNRKFKDQYHANIPCYIYRWLKNITSHGTRQYNVTISRYNKYCWYSHITFHKKSDAVRFGQKLFKYLNSTELMAKVPERDDIVVKISRTGSHFAENSDFGNKTISHIRSFDSGQQRQREEVHQDKIALSDHSSVTENFGTTLNNLTKFTNSLQSRVPMPYLRPLKNKKIDQLRKRLDGFVEKFQADSLLYLNQYTDKGQVEKIKSPVSKNSVKFHETQYLAPGYMNDAFKENSFRFKSNQEKRERMDLDELVNDESLEASNGIKHNAQNRKQGFIWINHIIEQKKKQIYMNEFKSNMMGKNNNLVMLSKDNSSDFSDSALLNGTVSDKDTRVGESFI